MLKERILLDVKTDRALKDSETQRLEKEKQDHEPNEERRVREQHLVDMMHLLRDDVELMHISFGNEMNDLKARLKVLLEKDEDKTSPEDLEPQSPAWQKLCSGTWETWGDVPPPSWEALRPTPFDFQQYYKHETRQFGEGNGSETSGWREGPFSDSGDTAGLDDYEDWS